MIKMVTKRDNSEVPFDETKILRVIQLAYLRVKNNIKHGDIDIIFKKVLSRLEGLENAHVEYIQNIVAEEIKNVDEEVEESFSSYRKQQELKRDYIMNKIIDSKNRAYIKLQESEQRCKWFEI